MVQKWSVKRRSLLGMIAGAPALGALSALADKTVKSRFPYGVASGDPLTNRVIIWTKIETAASKEVRWEISTDESFQNIISQGTVTSSKDHDHVIKVDAGGLSPGQRYSYRFKVGGDYSPIGRTKTLPIGDVSQIRFAVTSCANYPYGFFNAYRHMAERDDLDAVLHLGDYIYEYPRGVYSSDAITSLGRVVHPAHEILAVDDYRARYATYRLDPDLQAVHQAHPFIAVWDDHESANDSWKNGAENHNEGEGDWHKRRQAARQAYLEWMPVREHMSPHKNEIYRSFDFGNLARLIMLDTRLAGRDRPLSYGSDIEAEQMVNQEGTQPKPDIKSFIQKKLHRPKRTILGKKQEKWLRQELSTSKAKGQTWQILGQQVLIGNLPIPKDGEKLLPDHSFNQEDRVKAMFGLAPFGLPINLDAWDGYPAAKQRLLQDILQHAQNAVVTAGDTHNAWAFDIKAGDTVAAVEFGTPSVTSPGLETYIPIDADKMSAALISASPELRWADTRRRGYMTLTIETDLMRTDYWFLDTVAERSFNAVLDKSFEVKPTKGPGLNPMKEA